MLPARELTEMGWKQYPKRSRQQVRWGTLSEIHPGGPACPGSKWSLWNNATQSTMKDPPIFSSYAFNPIASKILIGKEQETERLAELLLACNCCVSFSWSDGPARACTTAPEKTRDPDCSWIAGLDGDTQACSAEKVSRQHKNKRIRRTMAVFQSFCSTHEATCCSMWVVNPFKNGQLMSTLWQVCQMPFKWSAMT